MTLWSTDHHLHHPRFDSRAKKRKHERESTSSEESNSLEPRATKRRRCGVLERGFADLSLYHKPQDFLRNEATNEQGPTVSEVKPDSDYAMDADDESDGAGGHTMPVIVPSHIEEPEQDIPEIQMKTSSWYELSPNRIVITDLDSFESEDEPTDKTGSVIINTPFLEHIKKQPVLIQPERTSQALVLYRPLPGLVKTNVEGMDIET